MTYGDIYTKFMIEYDKANITSSYPSLTDYEIATILDKAYLALIAQKLTGTNPRRSVFESDIKAIEDLRPLGRTARGVKAITMRDGDSVVDMAICNEDTKVLTITETGYGRISPISCYRVQSRGGKGLTNYKVQKYGDVAATLPVTKDEDVIMIASNGIIIRIFAGDISEFARPAKGVRVMRVAEGEKILSVALAEHDESEVTDAPEEADAE